MCGANNPNFAVEQQYQALVDNDPELVALIHEASTAMARGSVPKITDEGTSGTYQIMHKEDLLQWAGPNEFDVKKKQGCIGFFKPKDEEVHALNNPRGSAGDDGRGRREKVEDVESARAGVYATTQACREVAAYVLDRTIDNGWAGVPPTIMCRMRHSAFNNPRDGLIWKHGSLQRCVDSLESLQDFGRGMFTADQVHTIGILDIRILNDDRNEGNCLVRRRKQDMNDLLHAPDPASEPKFDLIPIDHGLSLPDCLQIAAADLCWMSFPQAKVPFSPATLNHIATMNPKADREILSKNCGLKNINIRLQQSATILLQEGARNGLTLHNIGEILYRNIDGGHGHDHPFADGPEDQQEVEKDCVMCSLCQEAFVRTIDKVKRISKNRKMRSPIDHTMLSSSTEELGIGKKACARATTGARKHAGVKSTKPTSDGYDADGDDQEHEDEEPTKKGTTSPEFSSGGGPASSPYPARTSCGFMLGVDGSVPVIQHRTQRLDSEFHQEFNAVQSPRLSPLPRGPCRPQIRTSKCSEEVAVVDRSGVYRYENDDDPQPLRECKSFTGPFSPQPSCMRLHREPSEVPEFSLVGFDDTPSCAEPAPCSRRQSVSGPALHEAQQLRETKRVLDFPHADEEDCVQQLNAHLFAENNFSQNSPALRAPHGDDLEDFPASSDSESSLFLYSTSTSSASKSNLSSACTAVELETRTAFLGWTSPSASDHSDKKKLQIAGGETFSTHDSDDTSPAWSSSCSCSSNALTSLPTGPKTPTINGLLFGQLQHMGQDEQSIPPVPRPSSRARLEGRCLPARPGASFNFNRGQEQAELHGQSSKEGNEKLTPNRTSRRAAARLNKKKEHAQHGDHDCMDRGDIKKGQSMSLSLSTLATTASAEPCPLSMPESTSTSSRSTVVHANPSLCISGCSGSSINGSLSVFKAADSEEDCRPLHRFNFKSSTIARRQSTVTAPTSSTAPGPEATSPLATTEAVGVGAARKNDRGSGNGKQDRQPVGTLRCGARISFPAGPSGGARLVTNGRGGMYGAGVDERTAAPRRSEDSDHDHDEESPQHDEQHTSATSTEQHDDEDLQPSQAQQSVDLRVRANRTIALAANGSAPSPSSSQQKMNLKRKKSMNTTSFGGDEDATGVGDAASRSDDDIQYSCADQHLHYAAAASPARKKTRALRHFSVYDPGTGKPVPAVFASNLAPSSVSSRGASSAGLGLGAGGCGASTQPNADSLSTCPVHLPQAAGAACSRSTSVAPSRRASGEDELGENAAKAGVVANHITEDADREPGHAFAVDQRKKCPPRPPAGPLPAPLLADVGSVSSASVLASSHHHSRQCLLQGRPGAGLNSNSTTLDNINMLRPTSWARGGHVRKSGGGGTVGNKIYSFYNGETMEEIPHVWDETFEDWYLHYLREAINTWIRVCRKKSERHGLPEARFDKFWDREQPGSVTNSLPTPTSPVDHDIHRAAPMLERDRGRQMIGSPGRGGQEQDTEFGSGVTLLQPGASSEDEKMRDLRVGPPNKRQTNQASECTASTQCGCDNTRENTPSHDVLDSEQEQDADPDAVPLPEVPPCIFGYSEPPRLPKTKSLPINWMPLKRRSLLRTRRAAEQVFSSGCEDEASFADEKENTTGAAVAEVVPPLVDHQSRVAPPLALPLPRDESVEVLRDAAAKTTSAVQLGGEQEEDDDPTPRTSSRSKRWRAPLGTPQLVQLQHLEDTSSSRRGAAHGNPRVGGGGTPAAQKLRCSSMDVLTPMMAGKSSRNTTTSSFQRGTTQGGSFRDFHWGTAHPPPATDPTNGPAGEGSGAVRGSKEVYASTAHLVSHDYLNIISHDTRTRQVDSESDDNGSLHSTSASSTRKRWNRENYNAHLRKELQKRMKTPTAAIAHGATPSKETRAVAADAMMKFAKTIARIPALPRNKVSTHGGAAPRDGEVERRNRLHAAGGRGADKILPNNDAAMRTYDYTEVDEDEDDRSRTVGGSGIPSALPAVSSTLPTIYSESVDSSCSPLAKESCGSTWRNANW